jgi:hypothetical protein
VTDPAAPGAVERVGTTGSVEDVGDVAERAAGPAASAAASTAAGGAASTAIDRALHQLARAIVQHPLAAQAAYCALVREGRAFAATDEGRLLRRQLARSELAARLRTAWQLVTLGMLRDDATPGTIPSVLVDALVQAALRDRFESRLRDALVPGAGEHAPAAASTARRQP